MIKNMSNPMVIVVNNHQPTVSPPVCSLNCGASALRREVGQRYLSCHAATGAEALIQMEFFGDPNFRTHLIQMFFWFLGFSRV